MNNIRGTGKMDPDYVSYNSALELNEEEDKRENLLKIKKIIDEEYTREIVQRQDQIEEIELQICKVRKVLHLLRYVLVMSYYKKKELESNSTEDDTSTSNSPIDKQNRIHPAVKKLLGKSIHNIDHLTVKDKRKSSTRSSTILAQPLVKSPDSKKIKLDLSDTLLGKTDVQKNHKTGLELIRNRKKTRYRIVVGNISKWMPSSEEDALTHKWMVYVRGPKEEPDVSRIIHKVVYYLHPSYKPYDVVEVTESPFHLSRRGWGEFPVRVQIYFKVTLNKPIDVIHNIKLDKTYSGRQTLGNETLVDVFLYEKHTERAEIKVEDVEMEEHDYCSSNQMSSILDHTYCLLDESQPKIKTEKVEQDDSNMLIYGLDAYEPIEDKPKTVISTDNLLKLNRKDIKFSNTKIIVFGKKIDGCILTDPIKSPPTRNVHKIDLPNDRFKNMGEALPYLFKRLPLYSESAVDVNYKRLYPFTAPTLKEFVSWNVGKRRNSEWSRARVIRNIAVSAKIHGVQNWNTKAILMFGRSHDYTPFISYGLFARDSHEKNLLMACYVDSAQKTNTNYVRGLSREDDEVFVNVESDSDVAPINNRPMIDISDPRLHLECAYVKQTALECGVFLKAEEVEDGVQVNAAELVILEAVKCLAENLIRRARNHRVCTRASSSSTITISKADVDMAIIERPECISLRQFKNKRREFDYFS